MVKVKEDEINQCATHRYLDGIEINNSCRQVYLRRIESIEDCKKSRQSVVADVHTTSVGAALLRLREEMVGLMDQDAGLMRQMLILNEKVEELKANNLYQMSKESLDSQDSLYQADKQTDKDRLESKDRIYTDEQSDGISSDEETINNSKWIKYDSTYYDSDEDTSNVIYGPTKCLCLREKPNDSLDSVFEKMKDFDTT